MSRALKQRRKRNGLASCLESRGCEFESRLVQEFFVLQQKILQTDFVIVKVDSDNPSLTTFRALSPSSGLKNSDTAHLYNNTIQQMVSFTDRPGNHRGRMGQCCSVMRLAVNEAQ